MKSIRRERNSSIELVRIISMIFIMMSHYTVHNGISNSSIPISFNRFYLEITTLGNIGVILFILISGYFLIESNSFKLRKFLKLLFQIIFYSVVIYLIFNLCGLVSFSKRELIKNILPVTFKQYWFITCYIVLYIFHPFINRMLNNLSRREYEIYLVIGLLLFSIIPSFIPFGANFYGTELIQFIMFYSIGGYLRKYKIAWLSNKRNNIILITSSILLILSVIGIDLLSVKFASLAGFSTHFLERYSILAIIFSVTLFNLFLNLKPFSSKFINTVASATLGVYLIHDNDYMRGILWSKLFASSKYIDSNYLVLHAAVSIVIIFVVCVIIDLTRQRLIEEPVDKLLGERIDKISDKLKTKIFVKN